MKPLELLGRIYDLSLQDTGFTPTHFSLLMALFYRWSLTQHSAPFQVKRTDMMRLAKIKSKATYHRCMQYLHSRFYIEYHPSYNPLKGSAVRFFPTNEKEDFDLNSTAGTILLKEPLDREISKSKKIFNNHLDSGHTNPWYGQLPADAFLNQKELPKANVRSQQTNPIPPPYPLVEMYFTQENSSVQEAERFYNHYSANGWLVGGKSPMKDWKASARNWISNSLNFNSHGKQQNFTRAKQLSSTTNKSYQEPL